MPRGRPKKTPSTAVRIKPLPGYALIEPVEELKQTATGIYLPDTASQEKQQEGIVLAVGGPKKNEHGVLEKADFAKNQRVIYKKWGGENIKQGEKELQLVEFKDVMAIVE